MNRDNYQDTQLVCLSGHQINASVNRFPSGNRKFCKDCSAPTIHECPHCKGRIVGRLHITGCVFVDKVPVPDFCENCGESFPWAAELKPSVAAERETALELVMKICHRTHLVTRQLSRRRSGRPAHQVADEYDLQDLIHALLRLHFDDVRAEEYAPSLAGGGSRVDFLLPTHAIVLELKMTRQGLRAKDVGEQLIVDIARYKAHPKCRVLVCFVYDPEGFVANPKGLMADLTKEHDGLQVHVIIAPET